MAAIFSINKGGSTSEIIASTGTLSPLGGGIVLSKLSGWDDVPAPERNTQPKILADGDFVSKYTRYPGRLIQVEMMIINPSRTGVRSLRTKIVNLRTAGDFFPLELERGEEVEVFDEAYIDGEVLWDERADYYARVSLELKTLSAYKKIYVAGSSEPIITL